MNRIMNGVDESLFERSPLELSGGQKRRIAIAGGRSKIKAVLGALRGGFINVLITDESCARGIAACINEEEE